MKKHLLMIILSATVGQTFVIASQWNQQPNFPGSGRVHGVGFSIGLKGYMGTGQDNGYYKDFWEFDQPTKVWTQKADLAGGVRTMAVGFSAGSKGYICTGNGGGTFPSDLWEFDPTSNTWKKKSVFPGGGRTFAVAFGIGSKGYIATALAGATKDDLWEYDQASDSWTKKTDFGGSPRMASVGFSIGTKGYVTTNSGSSQEDLWEWDQAGNTWTQKANFPGVARSLAVGFVIGTKGYVGTGADKGGFPLADFWEWNQANNTWTQKPNHGGGPIRGGIGFSIGNSGYIFSGSHNSGKQNPTKDLWEYKDSTCSAVASIQSDPGANTTFCVGQAAFISGSGGVSYQWSTGAASPNIVVNPTVTTTYILTVTDSAGCSGSTSITLIVDPNCNTTAIGQYASGEIKTEVFPNPFSSSAILLIANGIAGEHYEMKIFDAQGKQVGIQKFSGNNFILEREDLDEGIYFYQIVGRSEKITASGRFVIRGGE